MHVNTAKKKDSNKLVIIVDISKIRLGHIRWPSRGGVHKDKRQQARNNQRVTFKKEQ